MEEAGRREKIGKIFSITKFFSSQVEFSPSQIVGGTTKSVSEFQIFLKLSLAENILKLEVFLFRKNDKFYRMARG
ncbi:hypothetical protein DLM75_09540 [Leptospira stimsonii]|uniref:Uncharacterized protein n=1 Tax=Leptospira stimsonii TaxID=2202203 RepID=A0A396Z5B7_9LEPT|nr:hypothetical protein DLM75_09540 [Leptospira stimsonii]